MKPNNIIQEPSSVYFQSKMRTKQTARRSATDIRRQLQRRNNRHADKPLLKKLYDAVDQDNVEEVKDVLSHSDVDEDSFSQMSESERQSANADDTFGKYMFIFEYAIFKKKYTIAALIAKAPGVNLANAFCNLFSEIEDGIDDDNEREDYSARMVAACEFVAKLKQIDALKEPPAKKQKVHHRF